MAQTLVAVSPEELAELVKGAVRDALQQTPPKPAKAYLDAAEVATHFGVSRTTVHEWTRNEDCPHVMRGKVLRYELAAVDAWFRGRSATRKIGVVK